MRDAFKELWSLMPTGIKIYAAIYALGIIGLIYVVWHFVAKYW
jgi:hypothetical protein